MLFTFNHLEDTFIQSNISKEENKQFPILIIISFLFSRAPNQHIRIICIKKQLFLIRCAFFACGRCVKRVDVLVFWVLLQLMFFPIKTNAQPHIFTATPLITTVVGMQVRPSQKDECS